MRGGHFVTCDRFAWCSRWSRRNFGALDRDYAVAALLLGAVESAVGAEDEVFEDGVFGGDVGESYAGGERYGDAAVLELERLDGGADALGGLESVLAVVAGEQGDELLATDAGADIAGAEVFGEALRDAGEGGVAAGVAVAVVDLLEVIEVEQEEGEREVVAAGDGDLAGGGERESAAVEQAGEDVGAGLQLELQLHLG